MNERTDVTRTPFAVIPAIFAVVVLLAVACGGGGGDSSDGGDSSSATGSAGGNGDVGPSGAAWTDVDLERLVATEIDGYTIRTANVTDFGNATVQYIENDPAGPVALSAFVTFQDCDPFVCTDLLSELDEEARSNIRSALPRIHLDNPDLVEEIGWDELAGRPVLTAYFRSFVDQPDGQATAHRYQAVTHDGANLISISVSPDFGPDGLADSAAEMEERMDSADGAAVAEDILAAFSSELD